MSVGAGDNKTLQERLLGASEGGCPCGGRCVWTGVQSRCDRCGAHEHVLHTDHKELFREAAVALEAAEAERDEIRRLWNETAVNWTHEAHLNAVQRERAEAAETRVEAGERDAAEWKHYAIDRLVCSWCGEDEDGDSETGSSPCCSCDLTSAASLPVLLQEARKEAQEAIDGAFNEQARVIALEEALRDIEKSALLGPVNTIDLLDFVQRVLASSAKQVQERSPLVAIVTDEFWDKIREIRDEIVGNQAIRMGS